MLRASVTHALVLFVLISAFSFALEAGETAVFDSVKSEYSLDGPLKESVDRGLFKIEAKHGLEQCIKTAVANGKTVLQYDPLCKACGRALLKTLDSKSVSFGTTELDVSCKADVMVVSANTFEKEALAGLKKYFTALKEEKKVVRWVVLNDAQTQQAFGGFKFSGGENANEALDAVQWIKARVAPKFVFIIDDGVKIPQQPIKFDVKTTATVTDKEGGTLKTTVEYDYAFGTPFVPSDDAYGIADGKYIMVGRLPLSKEEDVAFYFDSNAKVRKDKPKRADLFSSTCEQHLNGDCSAPVGTYAVFLEGRPPFAVNHEEQIHFTPPYCFVKSPYGGAGSEVCETAQELSKLISSSRLLYFLMHGSGNGFGAADEGWNSYDNMGVDEYLMDTVKNGLPIVDVNLNNSLVITGACYGGAIDVGVADVPARLVKNALAWGAMQWIGNTRVSFSSTANVPSPSREAYLQTAKQGYDANPLEITSMEIMYGAPSAKAFYEYKSYCCGKWHGSFEGQGKVFYNSPNHKQVEDHYMAFYGDPTLWWDYDDRPAGSKSLDAVLREQESDFDYGDENG